MKIKKVSFALICSLLCCATLSAQDTMLRDILRSYTRALGELSQMRTLRSLKLKGSTKQQGQAYEFILYKKSPDKMRYEIVVDGRNLIQVFNGSEGWQWSPDAVEETLSEIPKKQLELFERDAEFESPLVNYADKGKVVEFKGRVRIASNPLPVFHLRLTSPRNDEVDDIYLDTKTYYEVKRVHRSAPDAPLLETYFSRFTKEKGFPVPGHIENFVDGRLFSTTEIEEAELNVGVLSFYFSKPKI